MNSFEINKIIAAIVIAVLMVFGIGKFTDIIFYVEKPKQPAYVVEKVQTVSATTTSSNATTDITQLLKMGDIEHGAKVFKKCSACHMIAAGGKNLIGPNLWSVLGRKTAAVSDYRYSKALANYGKEWTFDEMNGFLIKPSAHIKGTKMAFAGLKKEKDRASVILFMNSKSDNPLPTP
tara:strand:- start:1909 stop:2439 length:531 start_codon:yes stop_codon:yes gene_type:complete